MVTEPIKKTPANRILMITSLFQPVAGGTERQALALSRALQARGISVWILTRSLKNLPARENIDGIETFRNIRTLPLPMLFGLTYFISAMKFILTYRNNFTIVHCHILQNYHSIAAILAKWLFKKKVVIKVAATGPLSDICMAKKSLLGCLFLNIAKHADAIIALCAQAEKELVDTGFPRDRIVRIPNGVDASFFKPDAEVSRLPGNLLFVGRLDYMKGVDILLKSIASSHTGDNQISCCIVGDGPFKKTLQQLACELDIADKVTFAGACTNVLPYLQKASCFVLPSRSEGMPNVLLEAMACGLPIIATSVGGIPDIITDGRNGLLIPPDDVPALSLALANVLTDHDLARRLGKQASMDAEKHFSIDKVADAYLALYHTLTTQNY
jgi:glycosyltransferase involved in cell wall biosynthesis